MKRIEINTKSRRRIFAADDIKFIEIEKDCSSVTKRLYLNINTTPSLVAFGEEDVKNATDELPSVLEELEKFIFEPTNFSKMVINISEEKTIIEPAYVIVELQCEHGDERKECHNENIKHTISHSTDRYQIKLPFNGEHDANLEKIAKKMLEDELCMTLNYDYVTIIERNEGVYKKSYIQISYV